MLWGREVGLFRAWVPGPSPALQCVDQVWLSRAHCAVYEAVDSPHTAYDVSLGLSKDSMPKIRGQTPRQPPGPLTGQGEPLSHARTAPPGG